VSDHYRDKEDMEQAPTGVLRRPQTQHQMRFTHHTRKKPGAMSILQLRTLRIWGAQ
jgi:hypothetical protein